MVRGRKPKPKKAAELDAVSDAVDNSSPPTKSTFDGHDVRSPATTRGAKRKAAVNLTSVDESEKEELLVETLSSNPTSDLERLEKKIDFLVRSVQAFNSKGTFVKEDQHDELSYESKYFDSQKMVEGLTMENHQLSRKLESALAKIEVFEQMRDAFGHMKDMVLVSNMSKATDALINFTSQLTSGNGELSAIAVPSTLLLQGTSGEGIDPVVTAELNASLPKETSGADVTAKPAASSQPQAMDGQVTYSAVSAEPELKRGKRGRKKKEV